VEWDTDEDSHPNTIRHLKQFKDQLEQRREAEQGKMPWYALHWPRNRNLYQSPKVICRQTADTLIVTVDPYGHCVLNTIIVIRPDSPSWSPYFWAAILNSKLLRYVYQILVQEEERTFAEVKPVNLRKLPICRITFTTPVAIRNDAFIRVEKLFVAGQLDDLLTSLERLLLVQSDVIHDLLAYLAEQMIEMNKARQAEVKGFLGWLGREAGADLDSLTGKTTLINYVGDYQKGEEPATMEDVLDVLRRNQRKLSVDVSLRVFQERLEREYEASLRKLLPLKSRLAATDRLIDQIVYRLYGLTDDEIAIVEAR
jgi:hypothetical protein